MIDDPPGWVSTTAPYIGKLVKFLKHATPVAGAGVAVIWPEFHELIKNDIKLMTELVKIMPDIEDDLKMLTVSGLQFPDDPEQIGGMVLRYLRLLLDEHDPDHVWGGLNKILTPEGHYLWLCDHHAKEYAL